MSATHNDICRCEACITPPVPPAQPAFGDHVQDGGEWGTIIRCPECDGTGRLHSLDVMPEPVAPADPPVPGRSAGRTGERTVEEAQRNG